MQHMAEALIPVMIAIAIATVFILFLMWNHKTRVAVLATVQKSIKAGQELTPEMLEKLGGSFAPRIRDLRRGVVILFFGIAGFASSFFMDVENAVMAFRAISLFPIMVGAGFLLVWKLNRYKD